MFTARYELGLWIKRSALRIYRFKDVDYQKWFVCCFRDSHSTFTRFQCCHFLHTGSSRRHSNMLRITLFEVTLSIITPGGSTNMSQHANYSIHLIMFHAICSIPVSPPHKVLLGNEVVYSGRQTPAFRRGLRRTSSRNNSLLPRGWNKSSPSKGHPPDYTASHAIKTYY